MPLEAAVALIELATPIAEAVPILGTPVKGALEAAGKIVKYAQEVKTNKEKTRDLAEKAARWVSTLVNTLKEMKDAGLEVQRVERDVEHLWKVLTNIERFTEQCARQNWLHRVRMKYDDGERLQNLTESLQDAFDRFMAASQMRTQVEVATLLSDADRDLILKSLEPIDAARFDARDSPTGCLENTRTQVMSDLITWILEDVDHVAIYWLAGLAGTGKTTIAKTLCSEVAAMQDLNLCTFFASRNFGERKDPYRILHSLAYQLAHLSPSFRTEVLRALRTPPEIKTCAMSEQVLRLLARPLEATRSSSPFTRPKPLVFVIDALDECIKINGTEGGTLIPELVKALDKYPIKLFVTSRMETSLERMFATVPKKMLALHQMDVIDVSADVRRIWESGFAKIREEYYMSVNDEWPARSDIEELVVRTGHFLIFATTALKYISDSRAARPKARFQFILDDKSIQPNTSHPYTQLDKLYFDILSTAIEDADDDIRGRFHTLLCAIVLGQETMRLELLASLIGVETQEIQADIEALAAVIVMDVGGRRSRRYYFPRIFHQSFRDFLLYRCTDPQFSVGLSGHHVMANKCLTHLTGLLRCYWYTSKPIWTQTHISRAIQYASEHWSTHVSLASSLPTSFHKLLQSFLLQYQTRCFALMSVELSQVSNMISMPRMISRVVQEDDANSNPTICGFLRELALQIRTSGQLDDSFHTEQHDQLALYTLRELNRGLHRDMCKIRDPSIANADIRDPDLATRLQSSVSASIRYACLFWPVHFILALSKDINHENLEKAFDRFVTQHILHWVELLVLLEQLPYVLMIIKDLLIWVKQGSSRMDKRLTYRSYHVLYEIHQLIIVYGHGSVLRSHALQIYQSVPLAVIDGLRWLPGRLCTPIDITWPGPHLVSNPHQGVTSLGASVQSQCYSQWVVHGRAINVPAATFCKDGTNIISVGYDRTIRLWDTRTGHGRIIGYIHLHSSPSRFKVMCLTKDRLVVSTHYSGYSYEENTFAIWDIVLLEEVDFFMSCNDDEQIESVALLPDGAPLIIARPKSRELDQSSSYIRNVRTKTQNNQAWGRVLTTGLLRDGTLAVLGCHDSEGTIGLWDAQSGRKLAAFCPSQDVERAAFSLDGEKAVVGYTDGKTHVWKTEGVESRLTASFHAHEGSGGIKALAISPDGNMIAVTSEIGYDQEITQCWDTSTEQLLFMCASHPPVLSLEFSPDSTGLLMTNYEQMELWDVRTGLPFDFRTSHKAAVFDLVFSPDGSVIASASRDTTIRLWSSQSGEEIGKIRYTCNFDCMESVGFSQDGQSILALGQAQDALGIWKINEWKIEDLAIGTNHAEPSSEADTPMIAQSTINLSGSIQLDEITGWVNYCDSVMETSIHLCFLPKEMRGHAQGSHGSVFAVGTETGAVHIINFERTLCMFRDLGKL